MQEKKIKICRTSSVLVVVYLTALTGCGSLGGPNVYVSTGTLVGLEATPPASQTQPPAVTFGYKRAELALIPVCENRQGANSNGESTEKKSTQSSSISEERKKNDPKKHNKNNEDCPDLPGADAYSALTSFDLAVNWFGPAKIKQFLATGLAAQSIVSEQINAPTITSSNKVDAAENQKSVTTVKANHPTASSDSLIFNISEGNDAALFSIKKDSGMLTFTDAPDFENKVDNNKDGIYEVTVEVSDGQGGRDAQQISVTVTDVNEEGSGDDQPNGNEQDPSSASTDSIDPTTSSSERAVEPEAKTQESE